MLIITWWIFFCQTKNFLLIMYQLQFVDNIISWITLHKSFILHHFFTNIWYDPRSELFVTMKDWNIEFFFFQAWILKMIFVIGKLIIYKTIKYSQCKKMFKQDYQLVLKEAPHYIKKSASYKNKIFTFNCIRYRT